MIPDPGEVHRRRATVTAAIRLLCILPAMVTLGAVGIWFGESASGYLDKGDHLAFAVFSGLFAGFAVVLFALSPLAARQVVRMPRDLTCPACRYKIEGLTSAQCPECGLPLTSEFMGPVRTQPPRPDGDREFLIQVAALVIRIAALAAGAVSTPVVIAAGIATLDELRYGGDLLDSGSFAFCLAFGVLLAGAGVTLVSAGLLARLFVPRRPGGNG